MLEIKSFHKSSKSTATLNRINCEKSAFRYIGPEIINGTAWETKGLRDTETRSKHLCVTEKRTKYSYDTEKRSKIINSNLSIAQIKAL